MASTNPNDVLDLGEDPVSGLPVCALRIVRRDGHQMFAVLNKEDLHLVERYRWCAKLNGKNVYAVARDCERKSLVMMHRILAGTKGMCVDHANGCGLDNRRRNLRLATKGQNNQNRTPLPNRFKGVTKRRDGKFRARVSLGDFPTAEDAARAYDSAVRIHYGEFARLNFPEQS